MGGSGASAARMLPLSLHVCPCSPPKEELKEHWPPRSLLFLSLCGPGHWDKGHGLCHPVCMRDVLEPASGCGKSVLFPVAPPKAPSACEVIEASADTLPAASGHSWLQPGPRPPPSHS